MILEALHFLIGPTSMMSSPTRSLAPQQRNESWGLLIIDEGPIKKCYAKQNYVITIITTSMLCPIGIDKEKMPEILI